MGSTLLKPSIGTERYYLTFTNASGFDRTNVWYHSRKAYPKPHLDRFVKERGYSADSVETTLKVGPLGVFSVLPGTDQCGFVDELYEFPRNDDD